MPLKGQSELCASEPLRIFRSGPELWCEHWTLIFQREGLCVQTWLWVRLWCWKTLTLVLPVWASLIPLENSMLWGSSIYRAVQTANSRSQGELCSVMGIPRRASLGGLGLELSSRTVLGTGAGHSGLFFKWAELQMPFKQETVICRLLPKSDQI